MKKKIVIATAVILLAVLAVGLIHATTIYLPAPLRMWQKDDLAQAMGKESFEKINMSTDKDDPYSLYKDRYYGKYNGYYIVSQPVMTQSITTETIGEYDFVLNARIILAFKDGKSVKLKSLYQQGEISDKDLAKICEYHSQVEKELGLVNAFYKE